MRTTNFLRYIVLPAAAVAAGVKLGIKYAEDHYVVKDKKFIEGKIVSKENES